MDDDDEPETWTRLTRAAAMLREGGRPDEAARLYAEAAQKAERDFPLDDPRVAQSYVYLGRYLVQAGQLGRAELALRRAAVLFEVATGDRSADLAILAHVELADVLGRRLAGSLARHHLEHALLLAETHCPFLVARVLLALAVHHTHERDAARALEYIALVRARARGGDDAASRELLARADLLSARLATRRDPK